MAEILRLCDRAVPLMPEGTPFRMSVARRRNCLRRVFPGSKFDRYRDAAILPFDNCGSDDEDAAVESVVAMGHAV